MEIMAIAITPIIIIIPAPSHNTASGLANFFITLSFTLLAGTAPFSRANSNSFPAIPIKLIANMTDARNSRGLLSSSLVVNPAS